QSSTKLAPIKPAPPVTRIMGLPLVMPGSASRPYRIEFARDVIVTLNREFYPATMAVKVMKC
ncbi:hypothetical protein, partial [Burkholderia sp. HMSC10F09]|uniref:hypothetical protein n=1 Tax=Burkholderia sp. HMSC10F09 TaxID=1581083 RepID=UPI001C407A25